MNVPADIRQLINLWPTRAELAADLSEICGEVGVGKVHKWAQSSSIPSKFHAAVIAAAQSRGFSVNAELLVRLHAIQTTPNHSTSIGREGETP